MIGEIEGHAEQREAVIICTPGQRIAGEPPVADRYPILYRAVVHLVNDYLGAALRDVGVHGDQLQQGRTQLHRQLQLRDHRLRVLLPTGVMADTYFADSAFDVIERPIILRAANAEYREMESESTPQYTSTAAYDPDPAGCVLAVVSTGLAESAVRDQPEHSIALTLLRAFFRVHLTDGNQGGQIQGTHEFNYVVMPLDGALTRTKLCRLGQMLDAGSLVIIQVLLYL